MNNHHQISPWSPNHRESHLHQLKSNSGDILWKAQVVHVHLDVVCAFNHDVCMTNAWNQHICVQVIPTVNTIIFRYICLHIFTILASQPPLLTANYRWGIKHAQLLVYHIFMSTVATKRFGHASHVGLQQIDRKQCNSI